jgi:hypothetical protein
MKNSCLYVVRIEIEPKTWEIFPIFFFTDVRKDISSNISIKFEEKRKP